VSTNTGGKLSGLILDWGGVLTSDLHTSMSTWADEEEVELDQFAAVMREWLGQEGEVESWVNPVHALERGEMEVPDFERRLAESLSRRLGKPINSSDLLVRLFAHFTHAHDMTALVRRAKSLGVQTALLSNSWGNVYPDHLFDGMFDVVVISGDVGMRKPEERIYRYTLENLGLSPSECVFVDDLVHNVRAALDLGMAGIHHVNYERTAAELDVLFGLPLS
jgi:epoxide hydrolase-like predicted phosphatase